jgi:hypothetical protein
VNPVHIDPFAPVDSAQHPANWGRQDQAPAPERTPKLEHGEFVALLTSFGTADEREEFELDPEDYTVQELDDLAETLQGRAQEYVILGDLYGTDEEKAGEVPGYTLEVLRERHAVHVQELAAKRPPRDANKDTWLAYFREMFPGVPEDEASALKLPELRERTKLDGGTE